jgi:hypothetical protein
MGTLVEFEIVVERERVDVELSPRDVELALGIATQIGQRIVANADKWIQKSAADDDEHTVASLGVSASVQRFSRRMRLASFTGGRDRRRNDIDAQRAACHALMF